MKKMIGIVLAGLLLVGCSSQGSKNRTTCSGLVDGLDTEVVLNFDDNDQLVSMKAIGSMEADSEEQAEQLESMFSSDEDALKDMIGVSEGMSMDLKVKGKTVSITIDADVEQLVDVGLIGADDASEMTKDELISYFEDQDMTCK